MLRIVPRITKGGVDLNERRGLSHGRGEVRRVLARTDARHRAKDKVRVGMDDGGELRPGTLPMSFAAAPQAEIGTDVPRLEPRRVTRRDRSGVD